MIPYGKHHITNEDIDEIVKVLKSEFITQGPKVPQFEKVVSKYCGAKYGVAVNSATSALHIACKALDLGQGDILWTTPITFVASANCALYCNAEIDFVDIDPKTYNLCSTELEKKLIKAKRNNTLPKIVIPVHLAGQSSDMEKIHKLSQEYSFRIIEDASHAIGGRYRDKPIGSSVYSDITIFSFHPVKVITSGEGGMALTNNPELAKRMLLLRSHGITRDESMMKFEPTGSWYYEQIDLGYNYRMNDIQAALGISQMKRIENYVLRRNELAERYTSLLYDLPIKTPFQHEDTYSSFHLYIVRVEKTKHRIIFEKLREKEIGVNLHYMPVYLQPYYRQMGFLEGYCAEAEKYSAEAITLPLFPQIKEDQQDIIINEFRSLLSQN